jgi:hypothetical protein
MCHVTIDFGLIKIQSQPSRNLDTLQIADGVMIENRWLFYSLPLTSSQGNYEASTLGSLEGLITPTIYGIIYQHL